MAEEKQNPNSKLKLKNVKVVFFNPVDNGYGTTITIDCTDKNVRHQIEEWVETNNIGKDNPGVANIKEYAPEGKDPTFQFQFKINDFTRYAGINGLGKDDIGYGSEIDLIAQAYTYNNKFTKGQDRVGQSASAIVVRTQASSGGDADLAELLGDIGEEPEAETQVQGVPF